MAKSLVVLVTQKANMSGEDTRLVLGLHFKNAVIANAIMKLCNIVFMKRTLCKGLKKVMTDNAEKFRKQQLNNLGVTWKLLMELTIAALFEIWNTLI